MKINIQPISNVVGVLLIVIGVLMYCCIPFGLHHHSGDAGALFEAGTITIVVGILFWKYKFKSNAIVNKREGYLIVAVGWLSMIVFGALPYYFSGVTASITDAVFESVSGLTTTGATIFTDIEFLPKGILVWRSLTQWVGGMGIIVLTVAIFPLLGIAGIELFGAEAPGPKSDKIHPRIKETAKRLWYIYVGLTGILFLLLMIEGMPFYDSLNHALTTMATGGFSIKNNSIAFYTSPLIQYTITLFMFIAGTNYTVLYFGFKRKWKNVLRSDEFKFYVTLVFLLAAIITFTIFSKTDYNLEESFRYGTFQMISILTTTGYVTDDYTSWSNGLTMIFFILLFVGACAGSTSGGIKLIRHLVFLKNTILEFKRILHPRAIIRMKIDGKMVAPRIMTHILVFLLVYLIAFIGGSVLVTILGMDFESSIGAVATSLGNVGPGIGTVGPVNNFSLVPIPAKWILSFLMLMGRLELFTILILFFPYFWRNN
jgi:trk system potassium uptake protein TrkH